MENFDNVVIELIIQNFERNAAAAHTDKQIFIFITGHRVVKKANFERVTNIFFLNTMFEHRRHEDNLLIHTLSYHKSNSKKAYHENPKLTRLADTVIKSRAVIKSRT